MNGVMPSAAHRLLPAGAHRKECSDARAAANERRRSRVTSGPSFHKRLQIPSRARELRRLGCIGGGHHRTSGTRSAGDPASGKHRQRGCEASKRIWIGAPATRRSFIPPKISARLLGDFLRTPSARSRDMARSFTERMAQESAANKIVSAKVISRSGGRSRIRASPGVGSRKISASNEGAKVKARCSSPYRWRRTPPAPRVRGALVKGNDALGGDLIFDKRIRGQCTETQLGPAKALFRPSPSTRGNDSCDSVDTSP